MDQALEIESFSFAGTEYAVGCRLTGEPSKDAELRRARDQMLREKVAEVVARAAEAA